MTLTVFSPSLRWALRVTVGIEAVLLLGLGIWDATISRNASTAIGSALWIVAGVISAVALLARRRGTWLASSAASQAFMVLLALYIVVVDARSPDFQWVGTGGIAVVLGLVGVVWLVLIVPHVPKPLRRSWGLVAGLFPLLGLVQFWLETDYLPRTARPQVDVSAALVEVSRSGTTVHLAAQVTLHNHGSIQADIVGSLVRVTAYPTPATTQAESPETVAKGLDLFASSGREFRAAPLDPTQRQLLYSASLAPIGSFITPDTTIDYQQVIDLDTSVLTRARLSLNIAFITTRRIGSIHTCTQPRIVSTDAQFARTVQKPIENAQHQSFVCAETSIDPRNVVQALVADDPAIRTFVIFDDPSRPDEEFPQFIATFGSRDSFESPRYRSVALKIDDSNPSEVFAITSEYVVGDPPPKG